MRPDAPRDLTAGPDAGPQAPFPLRLDGKVIKGFGRGSSELGIPTANIPISGLSVGGHENVESGVYFGWAALSSTPSAPISDSTAKKYTLMSSDVTASLEQATRQYGATLPANVFPMVMSIGWNPFYKNTVRSVEVHLMHQFRGDFYGSHMNLNILGFIRPEYDYVSRESLVEDIRTDIDVAGRSLARDEYVCFAREEMLRDFTAAREVAQ